MPIFLILLIALPLIEIYLMIQVGSAIGAMTTLILLILSAILGLWLVRLQGFGVLMRLRRLMDEGEVPALEMLDGALILIAGLLLVLPGFLTDIIGFLLLAPPLRQLLIRRYVAVAPVASHPFHDPRQAPRVIEGEYRRDD